MKFKTFNPATGKTIKEYSTNSSAEALKTAEQVKAAFSGWKKISLTERAASMRKLAAVLKKNKEAYAKIMAMEMGKPITQGISEVEKCAWTAEIFADNAAQWLLEEHSQLGGKDHLVVFDPLGCILGIMPWNFPFWQVYRYAIPAMMAGNVCLLRHSNVCPQSALAIEKSFIEAGFPKNTFRTIITDHDAAAQLIASQHVDGVSLTGSVNAGSRVAELAGKNLKKVVLELGGSDPFVVLEDADIDVAAKNAAQARMLNTGQSCIAAKRFIVVKKVADAFTKKFSEYMKTQKVGDPMKPETEVGPVVTLDQLEQIQKQVDTAVKQGAVIVTGGKRMKGDGFFFEPTILTDVREGTCTAQEEVFGPVASIIVVQDEQEALAVANRTEFGLGGSVWTKDTARGLRFARHIEAGIVCVNSIVRSDPRMPFGGIKKSGIGRELSKYGLHEFVNIKTIHVYEQPK